MKRPFHARLEAEKQVLCCPAATSWNWSQPYGNLSRLWPKVERKGCCRLLSNLSGLYPRAGFPLPDLLQRPFGVFRNQRLRVDRCLLQRRNDVLVANVAKGDAHIAQKASTLGAEDRGAGEATLESRIIERE